MKKIEIFDPPMCCSTGVCGPSVDEKLVRFTADLEREIARFYGHQCQLTE